MPMAQNEEESMSTIAPQRQALIEAAEAFMRSEGIDSFAIPIEAYPDYWLVVGNAPWLKMLGMPEVVKHNG